jgi:hypothetical protein
MTYKPLLQSKLHVSVHLAVTLILLTGVCESWYEHHAI